MTKLSLKKITTNVQGFFVFLIYIYIYIYINKIKLTMGWSVQHPHKCVEYVDTHRAVHARSPNC